MQRTIVLVLFIILINSSISAPVSHFQFAFNSFMIPHPEKVQKGGEDAYFNSSQILAVADGVGGWNNQGIDPSKYSRFLCSTIEKYKNENLEYYRKKPLQIIKRAQKQNDNVGSSTMVVASLQQNNLKYCYIGDSGFMLIRKYQKLISIFEFVQQQHGFNFPFQLAKVEYGGDDPNNSICGTIEVEQGDIIVVGSDGLFDNIQFYEILQKVQMAQQNGSLLSGLAKDLAQLAIQRGHNEKFVSPFSKRAKQYNLKYIGGKLDDTTVIIAKIKKLEIIQQL